MDIGLLHFTRPLWLLALLPAALLALFGWRRRTAAAEWHRVLDSTLREHLLERRGAIRLPLLLLPVGWLLAALALAGPAWQQLPQPVLQKQDALVLVLDLSQSMYAKDIAPSRLERARNKLRDVFVQRKEGLTGLVAYAGDAFTIAPMTDDADTLQSLVQALAPALMPSQGSNPRAALQEAAQLLEKSGFEGGQVLLVTDGIPQKSVAELAELARSYRLRLSILGVGTAAGAPIPLPGGNFLQQNGRPVIARLDTAPLKELAQALGGRYQDLHLDDSDIQRLLAELPGTAISAKKTERTSDRWREEGPWLVLALLPLALLSFRRGWLLMLALLPCLGITGRAEALEWSALWHRADQQAAAALERGVPEEAAMLFDDADWRAAALYESGDYEEALLAWPAGKDAHTDYNRGNALTRAGRLTAALKAYKAALAADPDLEDAEFNHALVKSLIERLKQQGSQAPSSGEEGESGEQSSDQGSAAGEQEQPSGSADKPIDEGEESQQAAAGKQEEGEDNPEGEPQAGQQETAGEAEEEYLREVASRQQEAAADEEGRPDGREKGEKEANEESFGQSGKEQETDTGDGSEKGESEGLAQAELPQGEDSQATDVWLRQVPDDPAGLLRNKLKLQHIRRQQRGETRENRRGEKW